jgi:hypothetical protein
MRMPWCYFIIRKLVVPTSPQVPRAFQLFSAKHFEMADTSTSMESSDHDAESMVAGEASNGMPSSAVRAGTLGSPSRCDSVPMSTTSPTTLPPARPAAKRGRPPHTPLQQAEAAYKRACAAFDQAKAEVDQRRAHILREGELWDAPSVVARTRERYQRQVDKLCELFMKKEECEQAYTDIEWAEHRKLAFEAGFKAGQESVQQSCVCIACLSQI